MEKKVDIFDENGVYLGYAEDKSIAKEKGLWHKAIHLWIINDNNELLIQKRSNDRKLFPGFYDITLTQHILSGQNSLDVLREELLKSYGIELDEEMLEYLFCVRKKSLDYKGRFLGNLFLDTYLLKSNIFIEDLKLLKEEISEAKFVPISYLDAVIDETNKEFVNRKDECLMLKYELKKRGIA